jgi:hypothetical protein
MRGHLVQESGVRQNPSLPTLKKLAKALGVNVAALLSEPVKDDPTPSPQRYYVDFFDVFDAYRDGRLGDGWGNWGFAPERLFDAIEAARACRDRLNDQLPEGNKALGEHFGIIDRTVGHEVECVRQRS